MKKRNIIIIICLAAVILLIGGGYLLSTRQAANWDPCSSPELENAINSNDISLCELVPNTNNENPSAKVVPYYDNYCREICLQEMALKESNPAFCELINDFKDIPPVEGWDDPRSTGSVKDYCYTFLALETGNLSLCNKSETDLALGNCQSRLSTGIDEPLED